MMGDVQRVVRRLVVVGLAMWHAAPGAPPLHGLSNGQRDFGEVVPLWPGQAPGALGTSEEDVPTLTVFRAPRAKANGAAVVVFPGGGYDHLAFEKEGARVAHWLNAEGITAFVLRYRLGPRYRHPVMEQDGLQAIRRVRAQSQRYGIDPGRIAVLGFSAGGHLAGLIATHPVTNTAERAGAANQDGRFAEVSARPDAAVLVYPVVSMQAAFLHAGSRTHLLGPEPSAEMAQAVSLERRVTRDTPPTLLVASTDDRSVPVDHSLALYGALRAAQVPAELHVFARGRHGFGLASDDPVLSGWTRQAAAWLARTLKESHSAGSADRTPPHGVGADSAVQAVVDARYRGRDGELVDGRPTYRRINDALAAAPNFPVSPWTIVIRAGRYEEKVSVDKPNIRLVGAGRDLTRIVWGDVAATPAPGGGTLGTRGSWTLRATQPDFRLEHLTVENSFDYNANARKATDDSSRIRDTQGLALALVDHSDRAVLHDVQLLGHQDTFFADVGRTYVLRSRIVGNVDFIFGAGRVVIDDCDIVSLDRGSASNNGYITAPSTDIASYGILVIRSRLLKGHPEMAANTVSLGRPWHPGGNPRAVGMAIFVDTWMDNHISAKGWDRMSAGPTASGARVWFEPEHARFAEYRSTGPGAVVSATRRVLTDGDVASYSMQLVLDGWLPGVQR